MHYASNKNASSMRKFSQTKHRCRQSPRNRSFLPLLPAFQPFDWCFLARILHSSAFVNDRLCASPQSPPASGFWKTTHSPVVLFFLGSHAPWLLLNVLLGGILSSCQKGHQHLKQAELCLDCFHAHNSHTRS